MSTPLRALPIDGVMAVEPTVHRDARGEFVEHFRADWLPTAGQVVQANHAARVTGTLVGLHYHHHQADHWYVVRGRARAVLFDLRTGSPTEGVTTTVELGEDLDGTHSHRGLYIPPGVAHGFAALTDLDLIYLVDRTYDPADELGLQWDDPAVAADWGLADPILSARDLANPSLPEVALAARPRWEPEPLR
jgi:dTDP-4-dehydrorhamnose 3,5-epimerase